MEQVCALDVPVIDRALCERIFHVRRRRAIDLIRTMGGYQCGRTYVVERQELIEWLRRLQSEPSFCSEQQRKQKLTYQLDELHRSRSAKQVKIAVVPESARARLPEMPAGVTIQPGTLSVSFANTEELLARLYAFSQVVAEDFDAFCDIVQSMPEPGHEASSSIPASGA